MPTHNSSNKFIEIAVCRKVIVYLLVQSGQRVRGNHVPEAPQTHIDVSSGRVKSNWSLQNGVHSRPMAQSSQAFAPRSGGFKSMQGFAVSK